MRDTLFLQHLADQFTGFHRDGTNQHRLSLFMQLLHFVDQCLEFQFLRAEDRIRIIDAGNRTVCRNFNDTHIVSGQEFLFFCLCRTCHTGKFCIKTEEVLVCDRCQRAALLFDRHTFFCLDRLMQSV